jgi:fumarate reductase flavoprotein subunit
MNRPARDIGAPAARLACDVLIVGAGTAGIPAAIFAARRGARVILAEATDSPDGTLRRAAGHVSAGGTRLQKARGIDDTPEAHAADVLRITRGTADAAMVARACALAPRTVAWLDELGLDWDPACPAILHLLEAYSVPRTYWGRKAGRSIAAVLRPELDREIDAGRIDFRPGHRLSALDTANGTVTGAGFETDGGRETRVAAAQTVLCSGGYTANPGLFAQMTQGLPLMGGAEPANTGGGLLAARAIGAALRAARHFLPHVGGIEDPPGSYRTARIDNPALPPARAPWELWVDRSGARCLREDEPDRPTLQRAMRAVPDMTFWIVWTEAIQAAAPDLLPNWKGERRAAAFAAHPSFSRAETLPDLARAAGIDPAGLAATVEDYNTALRTGRADPMGRAFRPMPLEGGPWYAVRNHGTTATPSGGLVVDGACRVLTEAGAPIAGLYAAGEILGRELLSGDAFVGGMSITPALAFGRELGEAGLVW